jgi:threonine dehydratase
MTTTTPPAVTFSDTQAAALRIKGGVLVSPCRESVPLSLISGCRVFCKLDYLQRTGSFKERGARNALLLLKSEQRQRGVIAASAGNHALGLAYHGQLLKIPVTVVMPRFAPLTKVTNCRALGANVIIEGDHLGESRERALQIGQQQGLTYIHGYDDAAVIAGQGTMGLEILDQVTDVDAVIVPIGGAGLIAGVALAIKSIKPSVQVIGVEPANAASYLAAQRAGQPVKVELKPTLADGLAVPQVGPNAFAIARQHVDRVVTVDEMQIALAVLRLVELERAVVEGSGATPLAACLAGAVPELRGKTVVLPLCGGNIDTQMLGRIIERGLAADGRLCRFTASISDRPGGLAKFAAIIAQEGGSIRDIFHDRAFAGQDMSIVNVHCVIETRDAAHIEQVKTRLTEGGFAPRFGPDAD